MKLSRQSKQILQDENLTLLLTNGESIIKSDKRGVRPLLDLYEKGVNVSEFFVCDKVVGKGAAVLYVLLKIKNVYALTISKTALDFLKKHEIEVEYDLLVERILNRDKTGFCPIESAVKDEDDPAIGLEKIYQTLEKISGK